MALTEKKPTFTFIPTSVGAALPTQGARESLLSLCTQIKLRRSSTVSCQDVQLSRILYHSDTGKQLPAHSCICEQTYTRKILVTIFSCPSFKPSYLVWSTEWELCVLFLPLHSPLPFPVPFGAEVHDTNVIALIFSPSFWEREYFFF